MSVQSRKTPGSGFGFVRWIGQRGALARGIARALPSSAPIGPVRRRSSATLSMTSLIDVMVVCVVYLLISFHASGECGCRKEVSLPPAVNTSEIIEAPFVTATASMILVDGYPIAESDLPRGRVQRIDGLFEQLTRTRAVYKQLHPGKTPPPDVILAIDADTPAYVVKSIALTAAYSGYPSYSFLVQQAPL